MLSGTILEDVLKACGIHVDNENLFDDEVLLHINGAIGALNQNGVGLPIVVNKDTTWYEFENPQQVYGNQLFELVKQYVFLKTKIIFDPPPPSAVETVQKSIDELLWRLHTQYNYGEVTKP